MAALAAPVRLGTWNIHEALPLTGDAAQGVPAAVDEVVARVGDNRIDILALQEVEFDAQGESQVLTALARNTPLRHCRKFAMSESSFFPGRTAGVAIASRFPIGRSDGYLLPNPALRTIRNGREIHSHDKGFLTCTVLLDQVEIPVVSLHSFPFHIFGREPGDPDFRRVWAALAEKLASSAHRQLVICGDFNTTDRGLVIDALGQPMSRAVETQPTHKGLPIDDILFSAALERRGETRVVDTFSDHRLCVAELLMR